MCLLTYRPCRLASFSLVIVFFLAGVAVGQDDRQSSTVNGAQELDLERLEFGQQVELTGTLRYGVRSGDSLRVSEEIAWNLDFANFLYGVDVRELDRAELRRLEMDPEKRRLLRRLDRSEVTLRGIYVDGKGGVRREWPDLLVSEVIPGDEMIQRLEAELEELESRAARLRELLEEWKDR